MEDLQLLMTFLNFRINSSEEVFNFFRTNLDLENIAYKFVGDLAYTENKNRFLYVPGARMENGVVLVAHADTVRDCFYNDDYNNLIILPPELNNGIVGVNHARTENHVLGADDRAGCALLWLLRNLGHSLVITDGEEGGRIGAGFLQNNCPEIAQELNNHRFMVQFDRRNGTDFKCYDVGTRTFIDFIHKQTGFNYVNDGGFTDICTLCTNICGVNFSVGYRDEHTAQETLTVKEWEHTYRTMTNFLSQDDLPQFLL